MIRTLDRRLAVLERACPKPPLEEDVELASLLARLTDSELIYIDRGACSDAALVELLERARARRDAGVDMAELNAAELESTCDLIDRGKVRRVVLHPLDPARWIDCYSAEEGEIT